MSNTFKKITCMGTALAGLGVFLPDQALAHIKTWNLNDAPELVGTDFSRNDVADPCKDATTLCQSSNAFTRFAWYDGTEPTLSDSHSVTVYAEQFVFHLDVPSTVTITFTADAASGATLNPAFSVYQGRLPEAAHDDQAPDKINPTDQRFNPITSELDQAPGDPHIWEYLEDWVTPNPAFTQDIADWYAANYVPHNGYRDTLNYTNFTAKEEASGYFGQFDAFGGWSMSNPAGDWGRIEYISSASATACSGPNCETTTTGGFVNPGHFAGNNGNIETLSLKLAAGDYSIWAGGESGNSADGKGGAPCTGVNEGVDTGCTETRAYATLQVAATPIPNPEGRPYADAGTDFSAEEGTDVVLDGSGSSDPDADQVLTYHWLQTAGPAVALSDNDSPDAVQPQFSAPEVSANTVVSFQLHVTDNGSACAGGTCTSEAPATVNVTILPVSDEAPIDEVPNDEEPAAIDCTTAFPSRPRLWPPRKGMKHVTLDGVTADQPYSLTITGVSSDEPVRDKAAKDATGPDARIKPGKINQRHPQALDSVMLRAERQVQRRNGAGSGNGRVYAIQFTADDGAGSSCTGTVTVEVPSSRDGSALDDGQNYDATQKK